MLKKLLILSMLTLVSLNSLSARETGPLQPIYFDQQMNQAIQNAEKNVQVLMNNVQRKDIAPRWDDKLELQNAIIQLETKKSLVNNFRGAVSLQSPVIRQRLLEILNQDSITLADIAELQSLIDQYKATLAKPVVNEKPVTGATGL